MTHYEVLGVPPTATVAEIRRAYRRLARRHHPDLSPTAGEGSGARTMEALNAAWAVLQDPVRRHEYDAGLGRGWSQSDGTWRAEGGSTGRPPDPWDDSVAIAGEDVDEASLRSRTAADHLVLMPVAVLAAAAACFALSVVSLAPGLWTVSMVLLPLAVFMFLITPLLVMRRERRRARRWS